MELANHESGRKLWEVPEERNIRIKVYYAPEYDPDSESSFNVDVGLHKKNMAIATHYYERILRVYPFSPEQDTMFT